MADEIIAPFGLNCDICGKAFWNPKKHRLYCDGSKMLKPRKKWKMSRWTTMDGREIPVPYMTTTHLANAMHYCDKNGKLPILSLAKESLLEEWRKREKEGIWPKFKRFVSRVWGQYYTKKIKESPKRLFVIPPFELGTGDHSMFDPSDFH